MYNNFWGAFMNKKKIFLSIILLVILLVIIPLIINNLYKYDFGIELFRCEWSAGDMLSFYGSILGGLLTLVGVIITIKYERNSKLEEFELEYKSKTLSSAYLYDTNILCPISFSS